MNITRFAAIAIGASSLALSGGAAQAQSLFATPAAPWAGPYVGLHGGYGWRLCENAAADAGG